MKNAWWFKLYTKHFLIKFAKIAATIIIINYLVLLIDSPFKSACLLLSMVPSFMLIISNSVGSFRSNLEFHKMSIPFPELKRSMFLDMFIRITFSLICTLVIFFSTMNMIKGNSTKMLEDLIFLTPSQICLYVITYYIGTFYILSLNKDRKYKAFEFPSSLFKGLVIATVSFTIVVLLMVTAALNNFSIPVLFTLFGASFSAGMLLFHSKAMFNQFRSVGRYRDVMAFLGKGFATSLMLYFSFVMYGRNEVLDSKYTNLQRASSFEFAGPFAPYIDRETFMAIEPQIDNEMKRSLYSRVDFDIESVGLEFFLDTDPYSSRLRYMLTLSNPAPEFMISLYDHFEKNPGYWEDKKFVTSFKQFAYMKFPKERSLPAQYVAAREATKETLEKEKALHLAKRKAQREIASKKFR